LLHRHDLPVRLGQHRARVLDRAGRVTGQAGDDLATWVETYTPMPERS
jgi:hypothetical protein